MAYLGSKTAQQLSVILEWNVLPGPLLTYVSIHVAETVCMCLAAPQRYRGRNGDVLWCGESVVRNNGAGVVPCDATALAHLPSDI